MTKPKPRLRLTREALETVMRPPNNCRVRQFLDNLDQESRGVLEEALSYDKGDLPASGVMQFIVDAGFPEEMVPGVDAINNHRTGRRPCRCRG